MTTFDFAVWAPLPGSVELRVRPAGADHASGESRIPMERDDRGWWRPAAPLPFDARGELDYGYALDGSDTVLADPRSLRQPEGVHGWSRTYDANAYSWNDERWTGRQLAGGVLYEMHVGTFTPEGTLQAAIGKLDHLVEVGVDFVELLPVNAFNGVHNWGYDGVLWYAVHEAYGGPEHYQRFVAACHERGLAVIQDVVYNHLGPSGNYLPQFGPYLNPAGATAWGESPNLDGEDSDEVRRYIIDNVLMWLRDFHVDGLRLDAVHVLADHRAMHILEEMAVEVEALSAFVGRPLTLIAESDLNDPRLITAREGGGYGLTAQWSDDFHHALYVSLTGDATGYYADFDSLAALGKVFENGFFHDGTRSSFRHRSHGQPIDTQRTPTWRLVVCSDNHDQIGNRATGERLSAKISPTQQGIAAMITLLSPFTPMIFMGEEWGASTPWQFFTSHPEAELGELVAKGRVEEFAAMEWDTTDVPNPQDPSTFTRSRLDWSEPSVGAHADLLALHTELIKVRRSHRDLTDPRFDLGRATSDDDGGWLKLERGAVVIVANFSDTPCEVEVGGAPLESLVTVGETATDDGRVTLGAHSAVTVLRQHD